MKLRSISLTLLFVMQWIVSVAQTNVLLENFEKGTLSFTDKINETGKAEWHIVNNPAKDKINPSNKVFQFTRTDESSPEWAGFWAELNDQLKEKCDADKYHYLHIKYLRTNSHSRLRIKVEGFEGGKSSEFFSTRYPEKIQLWEIMTFDLRANNVKGHFSRIAPQPDLAANQPKGTVAYIDDIELSNDRDPALSFSQKVLNDVKYSQLYSTSFSINWEPLVGATQYEVYDGKKKLLVTSKTSCDLMQLKPSFLYAIKVCAINAKGERSKLNNALNFKTLAKGLLSTPAALHFSYRDTTTVRLKWLAVKGATVYQIYKDEELYRRVSSDSVQIDSLKPYAKYHFSVKAVSGKGEHSENTGLTVVTLETIKQRNERMQWWHHDRFGLFIHWGVYSALAGCYEGKCLPVAHGEYGEWIMSTYEIPVKKYRSVAERDFTAANYNAEQWVKMAKNAGMKYIVITTKHHDGFALFDSKASDWNAVKSSAAERDLLLPLVKAARAADLKIGFYYSQALDWVNGGSGRHWDTEQDKRSFDQYIDEVSIPQVKELLTNYGKIDLLWWDMPIEMTEERAAKFLEVVHEMYDVQKGMVINDRLGGSYKFDHNTPEQSIPDVPPNGVSNGRDWETCMTLNETWGYKQNDDQWKSSAEIIHKLTDIVSKGGNFLLNVGPKEDGTMPDATVSRLDTVGKWMAVNGEAIYGTTPSPFTIQLPWGRCTQKDANGKHVLYLHVWDWPVNGVLDIPHLKQMPGSAYLLADKIKQPLQIITKDNQISVLLPAVKPDLFSNTIVLEYKEGEFSLVSNK